MEFMKEQISFCMAVILRFLRLEVLPSSSTFYKMLFRNKLEFSSLIDFFV
jgi:hypothetical protein